MNTYRCTRNQFVHVKRWERQGYYISAENKEAARLKMQQLFPLDELGFTVTLWIENDWRCFNV